MYQVMTFSYAPRKEILPEMRFTRPNLIKILIQIVSKVKFWILSVPKSVQLYLNPIRSDPILNGRKRLSDIVYILFIYFIT